jgi:hypothetical protein
VVYSLFSYHQKNLGDPGSSRGMFERIRVGLTQGMLMKDVLSSIFTVHSNGQLKVPSGQIGSA